ncbi:MAG TPA: OmpW family outer membrane protein [Thermoanaerobaculia bacterium]|nr:OmpW family outer membrane protein [Thermoanaerobaculia bacterium]
MTKYAGFLAVLILLASPAMASDRMFEVAGWYVFLEPSAEATFNAGTPVEPFDASLSADTGYGASAMFFFGRRISTELGIGYVKTGIDLEARGRDANLPRRQVTVMPVTATLQLHLRPDAMLDPYIGVGAIKTFFSGVTETEIDALSVDDIEATDIGYLVNVGFVVELMERMGLLFDVKWAPSPGVGRAILNDAAGTAADIEVSPLMVSVGLSYRF